MSRDKRTQLTLEDRILWGKVVRSLDPLPGKRIDPDWDLAIMTVDEPVRGADERSPKEQDGAPAHAIRPTGQSPEGARRMDAPLRRKIDKGREPIEGRIDLHGLSQGEAYGLLLSFFHRAHAQGRRTLLVVTGKGRSLGSEGVLRRAVPAWLSTPAFRGLVHSHSDAARHHGGSGALYVRLRRAGTDR